MNQDNQERDVLVTTQNWFDALKRGDGAAALEVLDKDVIWINTSPEEGLSDIIPWLGTFNSRDAVADTLVIWAELSEVREFELIKLFFDGDEAVAIVHEVALVKPTGLFYDIEFVQRLGIKNGKIVRWTSYWDTSKGIVAFRGDLPKRLIAAVKEGDILTTELVLKAGINPNTFDSASPLDALMIASGTGNEKIVDLLLAHGANPNILDTTAGTSPLHKACQRGNLEIVERLVKSGAMVDLQSATTGHTPLMEAVWYKWPDVVRYLLNIGAGLNQLTHYGFTLTDHINYAKNVNPKDQGTINQISQLVEIRRKRDLNIVNDQKLMAAVIDGNLEDVKVQLNIGASVDARYPVLDGFNDQHTPLLVASRDGHTEIVKLLLDHGANVNAVEDTFGAVPLHKATYNGHVEITRILVEQPGVNLNFQGASNGYTPLHDALWHGFEECAQILVDAGARLDLRAYDNKLPADIAIEVFGEGHAIVGTLVLDQDLHSTPFSSFRSWDARERNGAQAIVEQLKVAGLIGTSKNVVIGNPGSGEEWLYMELNNHVHIGLSEAAVGSIVDGASRLHNKPAVAIAHGFVGFSGLLGDIFNAAQRQSPMLVIVGIADSHAHTGETHMFADVEGAAKASRVKYIKNATDPSTLLRDLRDAIIQAMIPPFGPVVFIVGSNVTGAINKEKVVNPALPNLQLAPPRSVMGNLADQLLNCKEPCILMGDGISRSNANSELQLVAELLGAGVWASMESEINFPRNHPLFRGNLGHMDDSRGRALLRDADYALVVGTPVYQTVFHSKLPLFQPNIPIAVINHDSETIIRGHNDVTLPIQGDPKRVLGILAEFLAEKRTAKQAQKVEVHLQAERQIKEDDLKLRRRDPSNKPGVTMAKLAYWLERGMDEMPERPVIFNEALVGGVGLTDHIKNIDMPGKYFDTSGGALGEWAGAVGAAMVGGPTLAFIGDGGFNYALQSLWNAAKNGLPLGMVVANNSEYGLLVANLNSALQGRGIEPSSIKSPGFLEIPDINYVKIAEGYGVPGMRVDDESLIRDAVDKLISFDGPFLVDLVL